MRVLELEDVGSVFTLALTVNLVLPLPIDALPIRVNFVLPLF